MPRPPRVEYENALYHVNAGAVAGAALYVDDEDRLLWMALAGAAIVRLEWICDAFCEMTNHFHLMIETPKPNLAAGMHWLNGAYATLFNRRHKRSGHVFAARYFPKLILDAAHFLAVARYVVNNPVRAGICERAEEWPWSSYGATAGLAPRPPFLTVKRIRNEFSPRLEVAQRGYRDFVAEGGLPSLDAILALTPPSRARHVPGSGTEVSRV